MADQAYDVIVVGARCAGSPLAMLLARQGHRVLLVDRATFPSDTVSTHVIHPPGVAALRRWGLLDQVVATGCPPVGSLLVRLRADRAGRRAGHRGRALRVRAAPHRCSTRSWWTPPRPPASRSARGSPSTSCVVDDGRVTGIRGHDHGGASVVERARVVVGADGRNSVVAKTVAPAVVRGPRRR